MQGFENGKNQIKSPDLPRVFQPQAESLIHPVVGSAIETKTSDCELLPSQRGTPGD
jgi:hypothetical protein